MNDSLEALEFFAYTTLDGYKIELGCEIQEGFPSYRGVEMCDLYVYEDLKHDYIGAVWAVSQIYTYNRRKATFLETVESENIDCCKDEAIQGKMTDWIKTGKLQKVVDQLTKEIIKQYLAHQW